MKIKIPKEILKKIGYKKGRKLDVDIVEIGERVPVSVTGAKYPLGIVISIKE